MDLGLKEKVVVITGAGQGVGREIAKVLAAEGAKVVVNDLYQERTEAVAKEITDAGGMAIGIKANVINLDSWETKKNTNGESRKHESHKHHWHFRHGRNDCGAN